MPNTIGQRRVDNILKMLLGVLSVAGLIALVIPETNPLPEKNAEPPTQIVAAPASEVPQPPPPPPLPVQFDSEAVSDFQIGAPTIDGNPMQPDFGLPFGTSAQTDTGNPDTGQTNSGGYTPPAFAMPGAQVPSEAPNPDAATSDQ